MSRLRHPGRFGAVLALVSVFALVLSTPGAAGTAGHTATDAVAPAGMHRYVVSVGRVVARESTAWVRLAQYTFGDDGTVSSAHWHWTHRQSFRRVSTGTKASGCPARDCYVRTAGGFTGKAAPEALRGRYTTTGATLRITWDSGAWEDWTVSEPIPGKLGKLTFKGSSYGQTAGWGYGSNASWTARAELPQIAAARPQLTTSGFYWNNGAINHVTGQAFSLPWQACAGGTCLSEEHPAHGCAPRKSDGVRMIDYYLTLPHPGATDRRNALEHWCEANADGRKEWCYTGNSHVKPTLQIVDSDNRFHGWVGVEASPNQTVPKEKATLGVFVAADAG